MTHITCMPTAKNRDQLQNPTLGNRVWATFTFFNVLSFRDLDVCALLGTRADCAKTDEPIGPYGRQTRASPGNHV